MERPHALQGPVDVRSEYFTNTNILQIRKKNGNRNFLQVYHFPFPIPKATKKFKQTELNIFLTKYFAATLINMFAYHLETNRSL